MFFVLRLFAPVLLALVLSAPARADWREAQSDHFVIYADDSEDDIRRFAEMLERYHESMELLTGREIAKPSPSNRVTIFVVGGSSDMRELSGSRRIAGFYVPRAGGSKAFVQDIRLKKGYPDFSTVILLHEYAHHFLNSSSRFAMPRWMSEGAAEFFAAATFNDDGSVLIGRPAQHRVGDLSISKNMDIEDLLDPDAVEKENKRNEGFYGRAWLLYHYLTFSQERQNQLVDYWVQLGNGAKPIVAAQSAFGDLRQLDKELNAYLRQRRMMTFALKPGMISIGQVSLRDLPEGEAEMMPVRIRSQRGVDRETALEVLEDARKVASKYPDDPGVLTALAEAEFDAGNDEEAIAAADKAIALDPQRRNAYVQKGYALFRKAGDAEDGAAAYAAAMKPFTALNHLENDHPLPLIHYYRSYVERGAEPPENARHALERASQLAPFDQPLAMNVAMMQAGEGKTMLARQTLGPLAANPHGGELAAFARTVRDAMEHAPDGVPFRFADDETKAADADADVDADAGEGASTDEENDGQGEAE